MEEEEETAHRRCKTCREEEEDSPSPDTDGAPRTEEEEVAVVRRAGRARTVEGEAHTEEGAERTPRSWVPAQAPGAQRKARMAWERQRRTTTRAPGPGGETKQEEEEPARTGRPRTEVEAEEGGERRGPQRTERERRGPGHKVVGGEEPDSSSP
jgi:hypothetical protein